MGGIQELTDKLMEVMELIEQIGFDGNDFDMEGLHQEIYNAVCELECLD
jgi:hypothetical protein